MKRRMGGGAKVALDTPEVILARIEEQEARRRKGLTTRSDGKNTQGGPSTRLTQQELQDLPPKEADIVRELQERVIPEISQLQRRQRAKDDESIKKLADEFTEKTSVTIREWVDRCESVIDPKTKKPLEPCPVDDPSMTCELTNKVFVREKGDTLDLGFCALPGTVKARVVSAVKQADVDRAERITTESRQMQDMLKAVVAQAANTANANCEVHNLRSACIGQLTGQQCVFNPYEDQDRLPGPGEALPTVPAHLDANPKPNDIGVCRATSNVVQDYYHRDQRELSQLRQRIAAGERFVRSNAQIYTVNESGTMEPIEDVKSRENLLDLYRSVVGRAEALKGEREREQILVARVEKQKKIMQKLWLRHLTAKAYNDQCRATLKVGDALETCNPVYVAGATQQCGVFNAKTGTWKNLNDTNVKTATATKDDICLNMQAQQVAWAPQLDVDGRSAGVFEIPNTGAYIVSGDRTHAPYYAALTVDDLQNTVLEKILQMMAVSYELARARHHAMRAQKKPLTVAPKVQDDDAPRPGENLLRDPESALLKGGGFRDKKDDVWFAAAPPGGPQEGPLKILPEHIPTRAATKEGAGPVESRHIRRLLAQLAALKRSVSLELERVENPMALALIRQIVNELGNQAPRGVRQELLAALGEVRMSLDHGAMSVYQSKLPDMLQEAHATMRDLKADAQKANALFALAGQAASNVAENVTPGAFNTVLQPGFVVGEMVRFYLPTAKQGLSNVGGENEQRRGVDMLPIPAVVLQVDRLGCPVWVAMYLNDSNSGAINNEGGLLTPSLGNVFTRGLGNAVNVLRDSRSLRDRHTVLNSWLTSSNVVGNESSEGTKSYIENLINKKGGNYDDYVCVRVGFKSKKEMEERKSAGKADTVYYTFPDGRDDASDGQARIEKLSFNHGIAVSPDGCDSRATACQTDDWSNVRFNDIRDKVSSQRIMMPLTQYNEIIAARKKQAMGLSATMPIPFEALKFPDEKNVKLRNKEEPWNPIGVWQQFYTANPTLYGNSTSVKLLGGGGGSSGGNLPKYMKRGSERLKTFEKLQKDWDVHLDKNVKCSNYIWQATVETLDKMFIYNRNRGEGVPTSVVTGKLVDSPEWGNVNNSDESYNWEAYINALNQGRISSWRNAIVRSFIALPGIVNQRIRQAAVDAKKALLGAVGWKTNNDAIDKETNEAVTAYYAAQQSGDTTANKKIAEEESRRRLIAAWNAPWFAGQEEKPKTLNFTTRGTVPLGDARMYRDLDSFKLMLKCGMADDGVCHETLNRILKSLNVRAERRGFALKDFQATVDILKTMHMLGYLLCDVAAYAYQMHSDTDVIESTKLLYAETSEVLFEKAGVFGGLDGSDSSQQNCWPEGSLMRLVDVASKHNVFMTTDSMAPDMGDALFCGALDTLPGDKSRSLNPNGGESYQQIWSIMSRELTRTDTDKYSASRPAPRSALRMDSDSADSRRNDMVKDIASSGFRCAGDSDDESPAAFKRSWFGKNILMKLGGTTRIHDKTGLILSPSAISAGDYESGKLASNTTKAFNAKGGVTWYTLGAVRVEMDSENPDKLKATLRACTLDSTTNGKTELETIARRRFKRETLSMVVGSTVDSRGCAFFEWGDEERGFFKGAAPPQGAQDAWQEQVKECCAELTENGGISKKEIQFLFNQSTWVKVGKGALVGLVGVGAAVATGGTAAGLAAAFAAAGAVASKVYGISLLTFSKLKDFDNKFTDNRNVLRLDDASAGKMDQSDIKLVRQEDPRVQSLVKSIDDAPGFDARTRLGMVVLRFMRNALMRGTSKGTTQADYSDSNNDIVRENLKNLIRDAIFERNTLRQEMEIAFNQENADRHVVTYRNTNTNLGIGQEVRPEVYRSAKAGHISYVGGVFPESIDTNMAMCWNDSFKEYWIDVLVDLVRDSIVDDYTKAIQSFYDMSIKSNAATLLSGGGSDIQVVVDEVDQSWVQNPLVNEFVTGGQRQLRGGGRGRDRSSKAELIVDEEHDDATDDADSFLMAGGFDNMRILASNVEGDLDLGLEMDDATQDKKAASSDALVGGASYGCNSAGLCMMDIGDVPAYAEATAETEGEAKLQIRTMLEETKLEMMQYTRLALILHGLQYARENILKVHNKEWFGDDENAFLTNLSTVNGSGLDKKVDVYTQFIDLLLKEWAFISCFTIQVNQAITGVPEAAAATTSGDASGGSEGDKTKITVDDTWSTFDIKLSQDLSQQLKNAEVAVVDLFSGKMNNAYMIDPWMLASLFHTYVKRKMNQLADSAADSVTDLSIQEEDADLLGGASLRGALEPRVPSTDKIWYTSNSKAWIMPQPNDDPVEVTVLGQNLTGSQLKIQDAEKSFAVRESRVISSKVAHFLEVNDVDGQFNQRYTWTTNDGETQVKDVFTTDDNKTRTQKLKDVPNQAGITAGGDTTTKVEKSYFIYDNDVSITQKGEPKRFQEYFYSRSGTVSIGSILDLMPRKDIEPWKWRWTQAKASADPNGGSMQDMRARILAEGGSISNDVDATTFQDEEPWCLKSPLLRSIEAAGEGDVIEKKVIQWLEEGNLKAEHWDSSFSVLTNITTPWLGVVRMNDQSVLKGRWTADKYTLFGTDNKQIILASRDYNDTIIPDPDVIDKYCRKEYCDGVMNVVVKFIENRLLINDTRINQLYPNMWVYELNENISINDVARAMLTGDNWSGFVSTEPMMLNVTKTQNYVPCEWWHAQCDTATMLSSKSLTANEFDTWSPIMTELNDGTFRGKGPDDELAKNATPTMNEDVKSVLLLIEELYRNNKKDLDKALYILLSKNIYLALRSSEEKMQQKSAGYLEALKYFADNCKDKGLQLLLPKYPMDIDDWTIHYDTRPLKVRLYGPQESKHTEQEVDNAITNDMNTFTKKVFCRAMAKVIDTIRDKNQKAKYVQGLEVSSLNAWNGVGAKVKYVGLEATAPVWNGKNQADAGSFEENAQGIMEAAVKCTALLDKGEGEWRYPFEVASYEPNSLFATIRRRQDIPAKECNFRDGFLSSPTATRWDKGIGEKRVWIGDLILPGGAGASSSRAGGDGGGGGGGSGDAIAASTGGAAASDSTSGGTGDKASGGAPPEGGGNSSDVVDDGSSLSSSSSSSSLATRDFELGESGLAGGASDTALDSVAMEEAKFAADIESLLANLQQQSASTKDSSMAGTSSSSSAINDESNHESVHEADDASSVVEFDTLPGVDDDAASVQSVDTL